MSCHLASDKQIDYADSLVRYLEENQHRSAARYKSKVDNSHSCIAEMSRLIDKMKEMREEIQNGGRTAQGT